MGALPTPPPIPMPMQGTRPGVIQPPGPGLSGGAPSMSNDIVSGINNFVQNYLGGQEARKAHFDKQFEAAIKAKLMGLTPSLDDEKIMKIAQKSHYGDFLRATP